MFKTFMLHFIPHVFVWHYKSPFLQYDFMGNASINDYVPFPINYKYDDPKREFRTETKKCNESYSVSMKKRK